MAFESKWTRGARVSAFGRLLLMLAAVSLTGCTRAPGGLEKVSGDCELRLHSTGEVVRLSSFKGKTLFFHVWATWCGPCLAELPSVVRLADQFRDDPNIRFVLVSIDENLEDLDRFIEAKGLSMPVYSLKTPLPNELQTSGIPATFFIDAAGTIRRQQVGSDDWDRKSIADELRQIAGESSPAKVADSASTIKNR